CGQPAEPRDNDGATADCPEPPTLAAIPLTDLLTPLQSEAAEQFRDVVLGAGQADAERLRDALVRVALGDQPRDLALALGHIGGVGWRAAVHAVMVRPDAAVCTSRSSVRPALRSQHVPLPAEP